MASASLRLPLWMQATSSWLSRTNLQVCWKTPGCRVGTRMRRIQHTNKRHRDLPHRLLQGARPGRSQQRTRSRHISPSGSFKPSWRCFQKRPMLLILDIPAFWSTLHSTRDICERPGVGGFDDTGRPDTDVLPRQRATREMIWRGERGRVIEGLPLRRLAFCRGTRRHVCDCGNLWFY
jgi:hypothetical protein